MHETAVVSQDLSKIYRVYSSPWDRLRELVTGTLRHREFRALEKVSFSIPRGEGLAIIGENGAGKSTLLKVLAGITAPSAGSVSVRGKVASILELGSGFHPELTGRQNIVLNAAMLGLTEDELRRKMPDIISFSELGEFIDQPVKVYSTGMAMRLGFSIATQVEPDVLIIDEALSVGDGYFQKKCMDRLLRFVEARGTLLFCSHAMYYVSSFCQRALWMRNGRVEALGPVLDVVHAYESFLLAKSAKSDKSGKSEAEPAPHDAPLGPARIREVRQIGRRDEGEHYQPFEPLILEIDWECDDAAQEFHLAVGIDRIDDVQVLSFSSHQQGLPPFTGRRGYRARLVVPEMPVLKGEFTLYVFLLDESALHVFDRRVLRSAMIVDNPEFVVGLVRAEHRWEVEALPAATSESNSAWVSAQPSR
ncbi:MAG TPA: ABC transporter ATP-binding protein [Thermoanaerobaculia bacterium]|jgi:ABC-type polysaccharide/polyol phosphate transport system ATPase subunit